MAGDVKGVGAGASVAAASTGLASEVKKEVNGFFDRKPAPKAMTAAAAKGLGLDKLAASTAVAYVIHQPPKGILGGAATMAYIKDGEVYANIRRAVSGPSGDVWYAIGKAPKALPNEKENTLAVQSALNSKDGKLAVAKAVREWFKSKNPKVGVAENYLDKKYGDGVITLLDSPIVAGKTGKVFNVHCEINDNELWGGSYNDELQLHVTIGPPLSIGASDQKLIKAVN